MMRLLRLIGVVEEAIAMACLVGIAVLVNVQFMDRMSSEPWVWTEEVSRVLMIWLAYLGCAAATRRGIHIGVDAVMSRLSGMARQVAFRLLEGLAALVFGFVCWQGVLLLKGSRGVELASTEWPIAVIVWAIIVGAGLSCMHAASRCLAGAAAQEPALPVGAIGDI